MMLHGEVRRAAEITQHFLELAEHPIGAAEPSDASVVLNGVLAERDVTFRELGVKLSRAIPHDLPMVACPMAQLTEMFTRLLDFSLRRLRDSQPPRELRIVVSDSGPSLTIALSDTGAPLSVEAEQRLVSPFRFTQGGGGEIEFALARALAQSSGGTLRLRPRSEGSAEVVVTLPKSVLSPLAQTTAATPTLPKLRILVVDDDAVNRQAMRLLLERRDTRWSRSRTASRRSSGSALPVRASTPSSPTCRCPASAAGRCSSSSSTSARSWPAASSSSPATAPATRPAASWKNAASRPC